MKVHMYENVPNFGDVLNKYIWPRFFGPYLDRGDDILMFGIGTVLGHNVRHTGRIIVCGSGCGYGQNIEGITGDNWKIFFVRGPLTAKVLGLPASMGITDPAILAPDIFKPSAPSGRTIFVPHWETSRNPLWRRACIEAGVDYIDPLAPVIEVVAGISSAKLVLTEAMHGAILADAYRIPWVPAITSSRINRFKWNDWADSLGIKTAYSDLSPLGMSDRFRTFTLDPKKVDTVQAALKGRDNSGGSHSPPPAGAFAMLKTLAAKVIAPKMRGSIKDHLYLNVGPKMDQYLDAAIGKGMFKKYISRSASELAILARKDGWLSDEAVSRSKYAQMQDKLVEVEKYLESYPTAACHEATQEHKNRMARLP